MKKVALFLVVLLLCINLVSCEVFTALSYSISGKVYEPVGDFSRDGNNAFIFDGKRYVLISEMVGEFRIDITKEDVYLGQTSNWPFFPNSGYYANAEKDADYIMSGTYTLDIATAVYLREDLYQNSPRYVLQDADYEFDFASAFIRTEDVSYEKDIEPHKEYHTSRLYFYVKDYPRLAVELLVRELNDKWYYFEYDEAFELSEDFLNVLLENDMLT